VLGGAPLWMVANWNPWHRKMAGCGVRRKRSVQSPLASSAECSTRQSEPVGNFNDSEADQLRPFFNLPPGGQELAPERRLLHSALGQEHFLQTRILRPAVQA